MLDLLNITIEFSKMQCSHYQVTILSFRVHQRKVLQLSETDDNFAEFQWNLVKISNYISTITNSVVEYRNVRRSSFQNYFVGGKVPTETKSIFSLQKLKQNVCLLTSLV